MTRQKAKVSRRDSLVLLRRKVLNLNHHLKRLRLSKKLSPRRKQRKLFGQNGTLKSVRPKLRKLLKTFMLI